MDFDKASAFDLAELIRQKKTSSSEVIQHFIDKTQQENPSVNAMVQD